jgi:O-acetyl-ADP-ribose deacetylase (regulator of RNase III)
VGGAFLLRYGLAMQEFLHEHLRSSGRRFVQPGEAVLAPACGSSYKAVVHAVAIDAFYETRTEWIRAAYDTAFRQLASASCRSIAAACLGCGYGRCSVSDFIESIRPFVADSVPGVESITFVTTNSEIADAISRILPG